MSCPCASSKRLWQHLIATAVVVLSLTPAWPSLAQITSPGNLTKAHSRLDAACDRCHSERSKVDSRRCLRCHQLVGVQIKLRRGYHARTRGKSCEACHKEHRGRAARLVRWPGGSPARFNHRLAGFPLLGKHKQLDCRKCHKPALHKIPAVSRLSAGRKQRTYLGLMPGCYNCHKDPHKGKLGAGCTSCHVTGEAFKPVRRFAQHHRTRFPLKGKHLKAPCAKCHRRAGKTAPWRFRGLKTGGCDTCHKVPHPATMGQRRPGGRLVCKACHSEAGFKQIIFAHSKHPATFPLVGKHRQAPCNKCHGRKAARKQVPKGCASCHRPVHKSKFGKACTKCHNRRSWRVGRRAAPQVPLTPDQLARARQARVPVATARSVSFHNKTRFPLVGRHVQVPCPRCHPPSRGKRRFKGLKFGACRDCHKDRHLGQLRRKPTDPPRPCEACHGTEGFKRPRYGVKEHDKARFKLEGSHRAVPCKRCHSQKRPRATRYTFVRRDCAECHPNQHTFRRVKKKRACAACHKQGGRIDVAFDHKETRFPLRASHARTACRSCHQPGGAKSKLVFGRRDRGCTSCHRDPHAGQFTRGTPRRSCEHCHRDGAKFKIRRFDHARLTGVRHEGRHAALECKACHHGVRLRGGGKPVTLYRLGSRRCGSCHKSKHTDLAQRLARRPSPTPLSAAAWTKRLAGLKLDGCERCHRPLGWRRVKRVSPFDHSALGYRLTGRHRTAGCDACHRRRSQPLSRSCSSCHTDPHKGSLGARCAQCHTTAGWRSASIIARHRKTRLPLTGRHALADCASCHPRSRVPRYRGTPSSCYACHSREYTAPTTHPDHIKAKFGRRCEQCHKPTGWRPAIWSARTAALHRSVPLTGEHRRASCAACHRRTPVPRSCRACHAQALKRAKRPDHSAAGFPGRCERCHTTRGWRPTSYSGHDRRFRISGGKHARLACTSCHTDPTNFRRYRCLGACHTFGRLRRKHARMPGYLPRSRVCTKCHRRGQR